MRKERNNLRFWFVMCYLRTKMIESVTYIPCSFYHPPLFQYIRKGTYLKVMITESQERGRVENLLPVVNLAARSVSQNALDDFSHLSATHALEVLVRNQAKIGISILLLFFL